MSIVLHVNSLIVDTPRFKREPSKVAEILCQTKSCYFSQFY